MTGPFVMAEMAASAVAAAAAAAAAFQSDAGASSWYVEEAPDPAYQVVVPS